MFENIPKNIVIPSDTQNVDPKHLKIMIFLTNAIENGWTVKKKGNEYTFTKKHEGKKKVFEEHYLEHFLSSNFGEPLIK
jgi:hypothetical protein